MSLPASSNPTVMATRAKLTIRRAVTLAVVAAVIPAVTVAPVAPRTTTVTAGWAWRCWPLGQRWGVLMVSSFRDEWRCSAQGLGWRGRSGCGVVPALWVGRFPTGSAASRARDKLRPPRPAARQPGGGGAGVGGMSANFLPLRPLTHRPRRLVRPSSPKNGVLRLESSPSAASVSDSGEPKAGRPSRLVLVPPVVEGSVVVEPSELGGASSGIHHASLPSSVARWPVSVCGVHCNGTTLLPVSGRRPSWPLGAAIPQGTPPRRQASRRISATQQFFYDFRSSCD